VLSYVGAGSILTHRAGLEMTQEWAPA